MFLTLHEGGVVNTMRPLTVGLSDFLNSGCLNTIPYLYADVSSHVFYHRMVGNPLFWCQSFMLPWIGKMGQLAQIKSTMTNIFCSFQPDCNHQVGL